MGIYRHAKSLNDSNIAVKGMISLEMIGYYSDKENSQSYPVARMKWVYGDKGNFITILQNPFVESLPKNLKTYHLKIIQLI
jgi:hypothetical protein